jgi:hypothetical protein
LLSCYNWSEAIASLGESTRLRNGGEAADFFYLAMAHHQLGDAPAAARWLARAIVWMRQHKPGDGDLRRLRTEAQALLRSAAAKR